MIDLCCDSQHHSVHVVGELFRSGSVMKHPGLNSLLQRRRDNTEPLPLDPDKALAHRTRTIVELDRRLDRTRPESWLTAELGERRAITCSTNCAAAHSSTLESRNML